VDSCCDLTFLHARPGHLYACKNGVTRRVKEWPGVTDVRIALSIPEICGNEAYIQGRLAYCLNGEQRVYDREKKPLADGRVFDHRVVVKVTKDMGSDGLLGKAHRKMFAGLLEELSGELIDEAGMDDVLDVDSSPSRQPSVGQSSLFPDEALEPPKPTGPDPAAQDELKLEYSEKLDQCESTADIGRVAKQAGGDSRLTLGTRAMIMDACSKKRKTV